MVASFTGHRSAARPPVPSVSLWSGVAATAPASRATVRRAARVVLSAVRLGSPATVTWPAPAGATPVSPLSRAGPTVGAFARPPLVLYVLGAFHVWVDAVYCSNFRRVGFVVLPSPAGGRLCAGRRRDFLVFGARRRRIAPEPRRRRVHLWELWLVCETYKRTRRYSQLNAQICKMVRALLSECANRHIGAHILGELLSWCPTKRG